MERKTEMETKALSASEFKARCLALLDEVAETGEPLTITKRGRPVAQLFPAFGGGEDYPQRSLFGTVKSHGDLSEPALPAEDWAAERGELA